MVKIAGFNVTPQQAAKNLRENGGVVVSSIAATYLDEACEEIDCLKAELRADIERLQDEKAKNERLRAIIRDLLSYVDYDQDHTQGRRVPMTIIDQARAALTDASQ